MRSMKGRYWQCSVPCISLTKTSKGRRDLQFTEDGVFLLLILESNMAFHEIILEFYLDV